MSLKLLEWMKPSARPASSPTNHLLAHEHRKAEELRLHLNNQLLYRRR